MRLIDGPNGQRSPYRSRISIALHRRASKTKGRCDEDNGARKSKLVAIQIRLSARHNGLERPAWLVVLSVLMPSKYRKLPLGSGARRKAQLRCQGVRSHISRTALARWYNRTCSRSEERRIEYHFLYCQKCQRRLTLKELVEVAAEAKKRLTMAIERASKN